jgi:hypothetical protein
MPSHRSRRSLAAEAVWRLDAGPTSGPLERPRELAPGPGPPPARCSESSPPRFHPDAATGPGAGIARIGLDSIPRRALQLRGRRNHTNDPSGQQQPREHEPGRAGPADHASIPRSPGDPESTGVRTPHRSHHPGDTRPPIARAHPTQHSYDNSSLGPPTSCGSTGQDHAVGNPRSHVSEAPADDIPSNKTRPASVGCSP